MSTASDGISPDNTAGIAEDTAGLRAENSTARPVFDPEKTYEHIPLIVIAGRPNTGKSTLFNRFLHRRRAITDPTPGVTRDPVCEQAFINGVPVRLMDTGGFKLERKPGTAEAVMDELVVEKTLNALKQADRILLLLEAGNITGEDEEFIALLRPYWDKIIAAVNKTEGGRLAETAWEFSRFGFGELLCISAEHGDNISALAEALTRGLDLSRAAVCSGEKDEAVRIAIIGKPNTGKSTLSNRLTHTEASIVSDYAGTTRDVVQGSFMYRGRTCVLLDTAGVRRKAKVHENVEYYSVTRAIKTLDRCDMVFLLIDAQEGLAEQDKKLADLASRRGRGVIFVLNKWDAQEDQSKKAFRTVERSIKIMFAHMEFAPVLAISARDGTGIKQLLDTALRLHAQLTQKTDTGVLNTALADWLAAYPPPSGRGNAFKIRYMVQTSINPVSFLLFATRPEAVPESYLSYLRNRIRRDLGYDNIPVLLDVRASRKRWEERERGHE